MRANVGIDFAALTFGSKRVEAWLSPMAPAWTAGLKLIGTSSNPVGIAFFPAALLSGASADRWNVARTQVFMGDGTEHSDNRPHLARQNFA
ncbi:hypothetical protein [Mesorhizobium caraganae]|uniref:hypothetical protein n=1 Tax=Mesorhizobium caraganae TaxID=483206 RepID=UPI003ECC67C9